MKQISQKEIEEIFASTDFRISVSTSEDINLRHCSIYLGDELLCCLRGNISDNQVFDKISFSGYNLKTGQNKNDTTTACRMAFMSLPAEKRDKLFDVLGFSPVSDWEKAQYETQQKIDEQWDKKLNTKPQYQEFCDGNKVFAVGQREQLILETGEQPEFIGTYGMGPCIGVAIISKNKEGEVTRVGLTHIDALTELKSLGGFVYNSSKDAESVDIVMVSSGNERERARKILQQILINPELEKKANVVAELDGSTSFAVNTLTGSVYKEIPMTAFVQDHDLNSLEAMTLGFPGPIDKSPLYDPEKRKNAQEVYGKVARGDKVTDEAKHKTAGKEAKLKGRILKDREKADKQITELKKKIEKAKSKGNDKKIKALQEKLDKLIKAQSLKKENKGKGGKESDGKGVAVNKSKKSQQNEPVMAAEYAEALTTGNGFKITQGNEVRMVTIDKNGTMHFTLNDQPMSKSDSDKFMEDLKNAHNIDKQKVAEIEKLKIMSEQSGRVQYAPETASNNEGSPRTNTKQNQAQTQVSGNNGRQ